MHEQLFTIQNWDNYLILIFILTFILIFNTWSSILEGAWSNICKYLVTILFSSCSCSASHPRKQNDSFHTMKPFCKEIFSMRWWRLAFYHDRNQNLSIIDMEYKQVYPLYWERGWLNTNYSKHFEKGKETVPTTSWKRNKNVLLL